MLSEQRPNFFYISSFIVKPSEQKRGIGSKLWSYALGSVAKSANLGLISGNHRNESSCDGILYRISVEPLTTMYRTRYGFTVSGPNLIRLRVPKASLVESIKLHSTTKTVKLKTYEPDDFSRILDYVQTSQSRQAPCGDDVYLKEFLSLRHTLTKVATDREGRLVGFGTISPGLNHPRLGPLFADHMAIVLEIIRQLIEEYKDELQSEHVFAQVADIHHDFINFSQKVSGFELIKNFESNYTKKVEYNAEIYRKMYCH